MSGSPELRALIESKSAVNSETGCWEWTGANSGVILLPGLDQWPWAVTTSPTPATSRPTTRPQAAAPEDVSPCVSGAAHSLPRSARGV